MNDDAMWPDTLLDSLKGENCVFFIGAGFSKESRLEKGDSQSTPPSWPELLETLLKNPAVLLGSYGSQDVFGNRRANQ